MAGLVLIVDDSPIVRSLLGGQIQAAGYRFIQASDGMQGYEVFRDNDNDNEGDEINMIMSDFNMPGMNGIEMIAKIKSETGTKVPCFILTSIGQGNHKLFKEAKAAGVIGWLSKPLPKESLVKILETYCGAV